MKHSKNHLTFSVRLYNTLRMVLILNLIPSMAIARLSRTNLILKSLRGGGSYIEKNPYYMDTDLNMYMRPKLGNLEDDYMRRPVGFDYHSPNSSEPKPLTETIIYFFSQLWQISPTIFYGTVTSILVFLLWQIPPFIPILRDHFVCSKYNIKQGRFHSLLLSAVSHSALTHLLMNLFGFISFGKSVSTVLKQNHISLGTFCIISAIASNTFFTLVHQQGSCIGLSGVTLSLFALEAKLNPAKEIRFFLKIFPLHLPAQHALTAFLIWSFFGTVATNLGNGDGTAHATHLFGLLYGIGFYEFIKKGYWNKLRLILKSFTTQRRRKSRRY